MAFNPFQRVPRAKFFRRSLPVILGAYLAGVFSLGFFLPESGARFQKEVLDRIMHIPEVCLSGNTVNDLQTRQCSEFWTVLTRDAVIAAAPFLLALAAYYLVTDHLVIVYRRTRKKMEKGEALTRGTVTDPPALPLDAFGWFHCLNAYSVELPNRSQLRVYLPEDAPPPRPGEQLAVFDGGEIFGAKRYFGMLYAPHLAIVRGGI